MLKKLENYISSRLLLLKIDATEKISKTLAGLFKQIMLLMFCGSVVFFVSIAAALWVGEIYDSMLTGFLVMAGIHLLILIIVFVLRRPLLETPMKNRIIRIIFKESVKKESTKKDPES